MNKNQQMAKREGLTQDDKKIKSLTDTLGGALDTSIEGLDKMFLLVCEARAAYVASRKFLKKEDFVRSLHNSRQLGTLKLRMLGNILDRNLPGRERE